MADPACDAQTEGGDLGSTGPNTRFAADPLALDLVALEQVDDGRLDEIHPAPRPPAAFGDGHNWVANELTWSVIGRPPSSIRSNDGNSGFGQSCGVPENVVARCMPAKGDCGRMFGGDQGI